MGFFQNLLGITPDDSVNKVDAAVAPYNYQQYAQPFDYFGLSSVTRAQAMQVPAVARARNIMCATIGSLPLEVRRESNNSKVATPPFIRQPDPRMTGQSVYTFLAEDLLFTGQGYLRTLRVFRPRASILISPILSASSISTATTGMSSSAPVTFLVSSGAYLNIGSLLVTTPAA